MKSWKLSVSDLVITRIEFLSEDLLLFIGLDCKLSSLVLGYQVTVIVYLSICVCFVRISKQFDSLLNSSHYVSFCVKDGVIHLPK